MGAVLVLAMVFALLGGTASGAVERHRKNLLKIQLRSDLQKNSSRIVLRLNQGGYYETEEDHENRKLIIKLFEFYNFGAEPIKVLDDPLIKGINVTKKELYLEIAIYLRIDSYTFKVSLFESPPICVVDIKATEPVAKISSSPVKPEAQISASPDPTPAPSETEAAEEKKSTPVPAKPTIKPAVEPEVKAEVKSEVKSEVKAEVKPAPLPAASAPQSEPLPAAKVTAPAAPPAPAVPSVPPVQSRTQISAPAPETAAEPAASPVSAGSEPVHGVSGKTSEKTDENITEKTTAPILLSGTAPAAVPTSPAAGVTSAETAALLPGQELFDQGLKAYQAADYVGAEGFFSKLVDTFPDSPLNIPAQFRRFDARAQAAVAAGAKRDHLAAVIDEYLQAVRAHEEHAEAPWAFLQVARLYEKMDFFYEAAAVYRALLMRYPESPFALAANFSLARLNFSLKRYQNAYDDFTTLLERQPDGGFSAYAHYYRANALSYLGEPAQALTEYRLGLEKDPDFLQRDPLSLYLLGTTYHRLLRYPEAKEYFLMMRNLFPADENTPQALAKIGEILLVEKKAAEAMQMFTTVVKEYPDSDGAIVSRLKMAILGEDAALRQRLEAINENYKAMLDSEAAYRYLLEQHPESPFTDIARLNLGQLYFRQGQYPKAREVLGQMLTRRLEPGLRQAAFSSLRKTIFAEIEELYSKGEYGAVVALQHEYGDDFLSRPGAVYPFLWVGEALRREGLKEGALEVFQELAKLKPTPEQKLIIDWGIGDLLLGLERFAEAESFIGALDLKKLAPNWRARILLLKVRLLRHRGQLSEALALLAQAETEMAVTAIAERVDLAVLKADLLIQAGDAQGEALAALEQAATLAFRHPQQVKAGSRMLLGIRLARMLYEEKKYAAAEVWFSKLALLAQNQELAELFYWQFRCQLGLADEAGMDALLLRLQQEYPASPWTASAQAAAKDFKWQQENRSLK
ncbi:MAG: tetratricopeptide repeat protein [Deltaproteobacteria bacterium]|nr:tetratricopeptide repeat protein [Deltaproteobacteria bacterium]